MVKVVRVQQPGAPEAMLIEDLELRAPGEGEALVEIEAIGLNRAEVAFRQGAYTKPPSWPARIGVEASGKVLEVGPGVTDLGIGQQISVLATFEQGDYGVYAERAVVPARSLLPIPDWLPATDAAAVWMQYFTAMALIEVAGVRPGDFVVVPAASSSVGLAAIQLGKWAGAQMIAATRRPDKVAALEELGADHVIVTERDDPVAEVMRITGGRGARVVFDPVGGPLVETWARAMAERGILFLYGGLSGQPTPYPHMTAALKGLSLRGWVAAEIVKNPLLFAMYRDLILDGLANGRLKPVIARTFTLDEIVEAHRFMESNTQVGKVLVVT